MDERPPLRRALISRSRPLRAVRDPAVRSNERDARTNENSE